MPPRIPTEADFAPLAAALPHALHFPSPPESTTAILVLLHGLGDSEAPFARFAHAVALPGVLAVAVRGTTPLPAAALLLDGDGGPGHFHWGDDVRLDAADGLERATRVVMDQLVGRVLVGRVLVGRCGWDLADVILFGFGQGGSLALGLASRLGAGEAFKGVVSVGGPLPPSMVPSAAPATKSATRVLVCQLGRDALAAVEARFRHVTAVRWARPDVAMPRDRDEMLPIIRFLDSCLAAP